ncbi:MAG: hypothetical protein ACLFPL_01755 [Candidatus Nanoarchaeia archaeon]
MNSFSLRYIIFALSLFIFIPCVFSSFQIFNEDFENQEYFSLSNLDYIIATNNSNNVSLTYTIDNTTFTQSFVPQNCTITQIESQYCVQDTLNNYIQSTNTSFMSAVSFDFSQNNDTNDIQTIYIDFISPSIQLNYSIHSKSKQLLIDVNSTDNLYVDSSSLKVLYESQNSSQNVEFSQTYNTSTFNASLPLSKTGNYTIEVLSRDRAGNEKLVTRHIRVEDIFAPQIENFTIKRSYQDTYSTNFTITDMSGIKRWRMFIGNIEHAQTYTNNQTQDTIIQQLNTMPDQIRFEVEDIFNNTQEYNFSNFEMPTIESEEYISDELIVTSPQATSCMLKSGFNTNNREFERTNSDNFVLDISSNNIGDNTYTIIVECLNNNSISQEEFEVVVDTTPPSITRFDVEADENGHIKILYKADSDTTRLNLLKNSQTIRLDESGSTYVDEDVEYQEEYEYELEAIDRAGNRQISKLFELSPRKVTISFDYYTQESEDDTQERIIIQSEDNLRGSIQFESKNDVEFNDSMVEISNVQGAQITKREDSTYSIETNSDVIEFDITRLEEQFTMNLFLEDDYSNSRREEITIQSSPQNQNTQASVEERSLQNQNENQSSEEVKAQETSTNETLSSSILGENNSETTSTSNSPLQWFWIIFVILALLAVFLFLYSQIDLLKNWHDKNRAYNQLIQKRKGNSFLKFPYSTSKNTVSFDKEIHKRIEDKHKKDMEKKEQELERKRKRLEQQYKQKSQYDQDKLNDLSGQQSRRDIFSQNPVYVTNKTASKRTHKKFTQNPEPEYNTTKYKSNTSSGFTGFSLSSIFPFLSSKKENNENTIKQDNTEQSKQRTSSNSNSRDIFGGRGIQTTYKYSSQDDENDNTKTSSHKNSVCSRNSNNLEKKTQQENMTDSKDNTEQEQQEIERKTPQRLNIDWDSYLKKKSKSRSWFLAQKEVDSELRSRYE